MVTSRFDSKAFLCHLTEQPGVYRMFNAAGEVIYVGKARNLKKRVASYFGRPDIGPRMSLMVAAIDHIEVTVTRTEAEALLLENNLIKSLTPRFNVLFRDDKSYPFIVFTGHDYPRIALHRGPHQTGNQYFGPFPNAGAVRQSIQLMQKAFRIRTCEDTVFSNRARPCLLYQIKRCTAPCVGQIDEKAYQASVREAALFLNGNESTVISGLSKKMEAAATAQRYEEASVYRDQITTLRRVLETQFISKGSGSDVDVIAIVKEEGIACVNLVMIRAGRHLGDKSYFPAHAEGWEPELILEAFIKQHYASHPIPKQIVLNTAIAADGVAEILSELAGRKVSVRVNPRGERAIWLKMAGENAHLGIAHRVNQQASQSARLIALRAALNLPDSVQRVECFDISHTGGELTVASCVVFDQNAMQNSEYRRYNIRSTSSGDDVAAIREVLTRRYQKLVANEGKIPDLILIDGGRGQVNVAALVLSELNLGGIHLIGIAKGEGRKPGLEKIIYAGSAPSLHLREDHPGLHLLQQIRDEAHRFAITGHRNRRNKARTHSTLESISGIGSKRRQKLLTHFGGLKGVRDATIEDLAKIEGISMMLAKKIYQDLH